MRDGADIDDLQAGIRAALAQADALRLYDVAARLDSALVCLTGGGAEPESLLAQFAALETRTR